MSRESRLIDDVLENYAGMTDEAKKKVDDLLEEQSEGRLWFPTPGPQLDAINCQADVLLYGGSGGCGKTDLILGSAFEYHQRTLIIRKHYTDLTAIMDRAKVINTTEKGFKGSIPPRLRTINGKLIDFGGLAKSTDHEHWQGQAHDLLCVGRGTKVLMSSGLYTEIQDIRVGDRVLTLEGPRFVRRVFSAQHKESVRVTANGITQIQSMSHELLTGAGWTCGESRLSEISGPTGFPFSHKVSEWFVQPCALLFGSLRGFLSRQRQSVERPQARRRLGRSYEPGTFACRAQADPGSDCARSGGAFQNVQQWPLWTLFSRQARPAASISGVFQSAHDSSYGCDTSDARSWSSLRDWMGRCLAGLRLYGERLPGLWGRNFGSGTVRLVLHQQDGVVPPNPIDFARGVLGRIPKCIFRKERYDHPYTKDARQTIVGTGLFSYDIAFAGVQELYDIEVDQVNHYITDGGFINKNCIDEVVQNREEQVRFLMGWVRSEDPEQRCRTIFASNPPTSSAGDWIIPMFAPWLDERYEKPALPGELRWVVTDEDGHDKWLDGPDEKIESGKFHEDGTPKYLIPTSRTFIPGTLDDNPFYANTNYAAQLDALPAYLRPAIRDGDFLAARQDDPEQVIPTEWIRMAQERWHKGKPYGVPMSAMGVDGARGNDEIALARRHDGWFDEIITQKGRTLATEGSEPHGSDLAAYAIKYHRNNAELIFDAGETTGAQAVGHLKEKGLRVHAHLGMDKTVRRTIDQKLQFFNKRAEVIWRLREALDPGQDGGSPIALPDDQTLVSDLTIVRWELTPNGIKVTPKRDVVKELGRSPDRGDAVCMCWSVGEKALTLMNEWRADQRGGILGRKRHPVVNMGPRRRR